MGRDSPHEGEKFVEFLGALQYPPRRIVIHNNTFGDVAQRFCRLARRSHPTRRIQLRETSPLRRRELRPRSLCRAAFRRHPARSGHRLQLRSLHFRPGTGRRSARNFCRLPPPGRSRQERPQPPPECAVALTPIGARRRPPCRTHCPLRGGRRRLRPPRSQKRLILSNIK